MNTTGKQVHPGDLITADLMNGLIADLAALDARLAKVEAASPADTGPGKGHGKLDVEAAGVEGPANQKIAWVKATLLEADDKADFRISFKSKAGEIIAAAKIQILDKDKNVLKQPFTLEPDKPLQIGFRFNPNQVGFSKLLVVITCETFPQDKNLNIKWDPAPVA